jgi:hypothetical protein
MSPPIREGSGDSIGSIRLGDGSEISEVRTGAGDVLFDGGAIPDSGLLNRYYISESGGTSSITDLSGNMDLSGSASSVVSGAIDGSDALRFDGSGDLMTGSRVAISPPHDLWMVGRLRSITNSDTIQEMINPSDTDAIASVSDRRGTWSLIVPSDRDSGVASDTSYHLFRASVRASERELFVDESSVINVTGLSSADFDGLTLGARYSDINHAELDFVESFHYDADEAGYSTTDVVNYISNKYPSLNL